MKVLFVFIYIALGVFGIIGLSIGNKKTKRQHQELRKYWKQYAKAMLKNAMLWAAIRKRDATIARCPIFKKALLKHAYIQTRCPGCGKFIKQKPADIRNNIIITQHTDCKTQEVSYE